MRFFGEGEETTIQKLAAAQAFWDLTKSELTDLAEHLGISLEKGADLFTIVLTMVMQVLEVSEDEAIEICHKRLVAMTKATQHNPALLQVDAALDVMDKADHQKFRDDQDAAEKELSHRKAYSNAYQEKMQTRRNQKGGKKVTYKKRVFPTTVTQASAKILLPPNSSIWKDNGNQAWAAHVLPYPRISERFELHGSDHDALKVLLQRCWAMRMEHDSVDVADCQIQGLF